MVGKTLAVPSFHLNSTSNHRLKSLTDVGEEPDVPARGNHRWRIQANSGSVTPTPPVLMLHRPFATW